MMMMMMMMGAMIMPLMMIGAEQPGARKVHDQTKHGDPDRLGVGDRHRADEPLGGLDRDPDREDRENERAGKTRQIAHLAGTEGKSRIVRMSTSKPVGKGCDAQGTCMGRHVNAIGEERHRSGPQASDDLDHHHCGGQRNDIACASLMRVVRGAEEVVIMGERIGVGVVHARLIT